MFTDDVHTDPEQLPQLVDIPTLAARLAVGVRHVRRLVAERRIPYVKVGYLVRFEVGAIEEWLEEQTRQREQVSAQSSPKSAAPIFSAASRCIVGVTWL